MDWILTKPTEEQVRMALTICFGFNTFMTGLYLVFQLYKYYKEKKFAEELLYDLYKTKKEVEEILKKEVLLKFQGFREKFEVFNVKNPRKLLFLPLEPWKP